MIRKYLELEIKELEPQMLEAIEDNDLEYAEELKEMIQDLKDQDVPYERIYIENEITLATLKKFVRLSWFTFEDYAEEQQPEENLENGFVTKKMLQQVLRLGFNQKANGKFPKTTEDAFNRDRNKVQFIKTKLEELLK